MKNKLLIIPAFIVAPFISPQNQKHTVSVETNSIVADSVSSKSRTEEKGEMVNGTMMYASKNLRENISASERLGLFSKMLSRADLASTLAGKGDFTVFAPSNDAIEKLSQNKLDSLNTHPKELTALLTYHILSGNIDLKELVKSIRKNEGEAEYMTISGSKVYFSLENDQIVIRDELGKKAVVEQGSIDQKNGSLYLINQVLVPKNRL